MPALTNPRWEKYARGLAQGMSQIQAYHAAGYHRNENQKTHAAPSILARRQEIRARVQELIEEEAKEKEARMRLAPMPAPQYESSDAPAEVDPRSLVTEAWVVQQLIENYGAAHQAGQFASANKALQLLGAYLGMFSDDEVKARKKKEAEAQEQGPKKITGADIDSVNNLLAKVGFEGTIDLTSPTTNVEKVIQRRKSANKARAEAGKSEANAPDQSGGTT